MNNILRVGRLAPPLLFLLCHNPLLANDDAELSFRVIARTAVPLLKVFTDRADWAELFRHAMIGMLLKADANNS